MQSKYSLKISHTGVAKSRDYYTSKRRDLKKEKKIIRKVKPPNRCNLIFTKCF